MSPVLKSGKFTYVPERYAELDEWIGADPGTTRIVRDNEIHFGGQWLETLVGIDLDFHGAESCAFMVDGVVFEVLMDPDDGLRSHMAGVVARSTRDYNLYEKPIARVQMKKLSDEKRDTDDVEKMHGYEIVDIEDGHVWLTFGTEWNDDYYPLFRFQYTPKKRGEDS